MAGETKDDKKSSGFPKINWASHVLFAALVLLGAMTCVIYGIQNAGKSLTNVTIAVAGGNAPTPMMTPPVFDPNIISYTFTALRTSTSFTFTVTPQSTGDQIFTYIPNTPAVAGNIPPAPVGDIGMVLRTTPTTTAGAQVTFTINVMPLVPPQLDVNSIGILVRAPNLTQTLYQFFINWQ